MDLVKVSLALASTFLVAFRVPAEAQPAPNNHAPTLLVNVLDRNGGAVRDLTKDSFRVKVNGRASAIVEASYSLAPRRIVVLLDMSGSMVESRGQQKWEIAREALEDLLADTPHEVPIALLAFADQVKDSFDFSQSRSSISAWLKEGATTHGDNRIHGRTALFDAVLSATRLLGPAKPGDAIYAITDAGDNSSHISARNTRKVLLDSKIRLFVFLFAEQLPFADVRSGTEALTEMARATRGFVFGVPGRSTGVEFMPSWVVYDYDGRTRDKIKLYTRALNIQVNGFYTLRFDSPIPAGKAHKVFLDIVDAKGNPRKDVAFTYSTILLPQLK